jgi:hypothetical protein
VVNYQYITILFKIIELDDEIQQKLTQAGYQLLPNFKFHISRVINHMINLQEKRIFFSKNDFFLLKRKYFDYICQDEISQNGRLWHNHL